MICNLYQIISLYYLTWTKQERKLFNEVEKRDL